MVLSLSQGVVGYPAGNDRPLRVYLVRHTETVWNAERRLEGWSDPPLSPAGRRQASRLAERLRGEQLDAVYASTLARSEETARIIAGNHPVIALPDLRERNLGIFEGRLENDPAFLARVGIPGDALGTGETHDQFNKRVREALNAIRRQHPYGSVLIVGHNGTNQVILRDLLKITPEAAMRIAQATDDIYLIELVPRRSPSLRVLPADVTR